MNEDLYEVRYLILDVRLFKDHWHEGIVTTSGGSGSTRMPLAKLPDWMDHHPGAMVCSIRKVTP